MLASASQGRTILSIMWILPFILIASIVFAAGIWLGYLIRFRQNAGEAMVANAISGGLQRFHLLLNNITLPIENGTTQIDHVLIMDSGIFVIETKHYEGWIFGDPHSGQWTQVIYRKKSKFQNPLRQNYGHVKALESLFKLPSEAFFNIVVFTGDAEFKTNLGPEVFKLHQLVRHLQLERPTRFDEKQMTYIVGRIEMKRLRRSIETDEYHLSRVRQRIKG